MPLVVIVMAPTGQRASQRRHPVQLASSCNTANLRHSIVRNAINGKWQAAMHRPQPVQRVGSIKGICGARGMSESVAINGNFGQLLRGTAILRAMQLQDILYSQGFGTRRVCAGLIQQGHVQVFGAAGAEPSQTCTDASADFDTEGLRFKVQGVVWPYAEKAYLVLNKPTATECSQKPSTYPSIYTLLPSPLRMRPQKGAVQGVQAVGRLDQDTTGMLLLTDDGKFIHRMSSPRHHVPKVYEVRVKHPLDERQINKLLEGVVLEDDPKPVRAAACEATGEFDLRLTLTEGKYHQVKRMLAAVSNRVEGLRRSQIGGLKLPADLEPGQWRWLSPDDLALIAGA
jgi:16S rRNA pseudouridine516 synthase